MLCLENTNLYSLATTPVVYFEISSSYTLIAAFQMTKQNKIVGLEYGNVISYGTSVSSSTYLESSNVKAGIFLQLWLRCK